MRSTRPTDCQMSRPQCLLYLYAEVLEDLIMGGIVALVSYNRRVAQDTYKTSMTLALNATGLTVSLMLLRS